MEPALCYVRVSTQEQAQTGVSLDAQSSRLGSYCEAMGLDPIQIIREEGVSAGKPLVTRPGGQRLLQLLDSGIANHVVALKLDRLFRSTEDALQWTSRWDAADITLHLTDMGGQTLNTSSAMGRMMLTLLASFAEFERNLVAERTVSALAYKKRKGKAYNHTPYGFRKEGSDLVAYEREQKVLKHMFQWRREGASLLTISNRLNELEIPAKKGGRWHAATVGHILGNDLHRQANGATNRFSGKQSRGRHTNPAENEIIGQLSGLLT